MVIHALYFQNPQDCWGRRVLFTLLLKDRYPVGTLFLLPNHLIDSGIWATLTGSEAKVLLIFHRYANEAGESHPKIARIAQLTGYHRRSVSLAIAGLKRKNLVQVSTRPRPPEGFCIGGSNLFQVNELGATIHG